MARVLLLVCASGVLAPIVRAQSATPALTPAAYVAELDRVIAAVGRLDEARPGDANALITQLPASWRGAAGSTAFDVPTEWLRRDLTAWHDHPTAAQRRQIGEHLRGLRFEAAAFDAPARTPEGARQELNRILAAREFQNVHGQTWLDRLRDRVTSWLLNLFGSALGSSTMGVVTNVIVIVLIVGGAVALAFVTIRALQRSARLDLVNLSAPSPIARPWSVTLADAERAAAHGDWREAVHLAYWCGVAFVEAREQWRPDRARTPREYLRLLPASSEQFPPLRSLTMLVERVWYGARPADATSFDAALAQLKQLGCPSA